MSINKIQGMKQKRKVRVCQNLGTVAKSQRLLLKCEQDRARFKRLYLYEAMEHRKAARQLEIETRHAGCYSDCVEFLYLALLEAVNLNKEGIEGKLREYRAFRNALFEKHTKTIEELNKVEADTLGKHIVAYVGI